MNRLPTYDNLKSGISPQHQQWPGLTGDMNPRPDHGEDWYKGTDKLAGKVALITGGDSGIGRAVALMFAREGANVAISYFDEEEDAQETLQLITEAGQRGIALPGDLTDPEHCQSIVRQTVEQLGGLDILINNAAYQHELQGLEELKVEEAERVFKTNILAMFWITQEALKHLKPGSSIICTGSVQALDGDPMLIDYACTKAAIHNFARALAKQLASRRIRVNVVAPGPVWTPLIPATFSAESVAGFGSGTYWGRPAMPAEIATAYVYLASDDAQYVTGETIAITGQEITSR